MERMRSKLRVAMALVVGVLTTSAIGAVPAIAAVPATSEVAGGAVFTMSNSAAGNQVVAFARASDGTLTHVGDYATGGEGSGAGLGSQGSVRLSDDGSWLLVVNAGSDEVSVFAASGASLTLTDTVSSGGDSPTSVDIHGDLVYVLNAGSANIAGFRLTASGELAPVRGPIRSLSAPDAAPAQIEFSPDGSSLVVTEKNTNLIVTYGVSASGVATTGKISVSAGITPFGFEFDPAGRLIVSEAAGGALDASTVSSYDLAPNRKAALIDGPIPTTETAACWLVVTDDGRFAYAANTGSDSITGYGVDLQGALSILDADGVTALTGDVPIDVALSDGSGYLYSFGSGSDTITVLRVESDGSLSLVETVSGLPATSVGLAAA